MFSECSAKTGENIEFIFSELHLKIKYFFEHLLIFLFLWGGGLDKSNKK